MAVEEVGIKLNLQGRAETGKGLRDTDAEIEQLGTSAEQAQSKLTKGLGAVEEGGRKVSAGVKLAAGALAATAVAAGTSLARVGIGYNNLEQTSRAAMTTLLGTREAADAMMDAVRDFGRTSPFPRQAFISATQQLLGFGFSAESIIPTLKTINDTTAALGGNAQTIGTLSDIFASIKSQGKLSGDQVQRLGAIGVNVLDILQKASGKSADEVQKAISKGAIKADDAIAVLTDGMNRRFGGASDNVKNTWAGATDRVKGAWRDLGSELVKPFVDPNGGGYAVKWANQLADKIRQVQGEVPGIMAKLATGAAAARNGGNGDLASPYERMAFWATKAYLVVRAMDLPGMLRRVVTAISGKGPSELFASLQAQGPAVRASLVSIGNSLAELSPVFAALGEEAPSLTTSLKLVSGALSFMARHADTIAALIPFLVAGWVAYRLALSTAAAVQKVFAAQQALSVLTSMRATSATAANTAAMRALAIEMARARGATAAEMAALNGTTAATLRSTIASKAARVATLAQAAAAKVAQGAQWLWNAALTANPIGLVVVALAALVGGAIYAYKHFDWFRNAVDAVWKGLKTAGKWLWDTVLPFTPLGLAIKGGIALVKEIKSHWGEFVEILKKGATWLVKVGDAIGLGAVRKLVGDVFGGNAENTGVASQEPARRATGGPVKAGQGYIVGEDRAEFFQPTTDGIIRPRVPTQAAGERVAASTTVSGGGGMSGGDLHVHLEVDGHELGAIVLKDWRGRMARQ